MKEETIKNALIWDKVGQFDSRLLQDIKDAQPKFEDYNAHVGNAVGVAGGIASDNTDDWNLVGNRNYLGGVGLWEQMQNDRTQKYAYNQKEYLEHMEKIFKAGSPDDFFHNPIPDKSVKRIPLKFRRNVE